MTRTAAARTVSSTARMPVDRFFGMIGATYSVFQLIGAPILGRWSDRFGRRRILLLSQVGTLVSWLVFLVAFFVPVSVIREVDSDVLGRFSITLPLLILFVARATDGLNPGEASWRARSRQLARPGSPRRRVRS